MAGVLEISNLMSELFSLLLLHDPSVSLFRLIDSVCTSLLFSAIICISELAHQSRTRRSKHEGISSFDL